MPAAAPRDDALRGRLLEALSSSVVDGLVIGAVADAIGRSLPSSHVAVWWVDDGHLRAVTCWENDLAGSGRESDGDRFRTATLATRASGTTSVLGRVGAADGHRVLTVDELDDARYSVFAEPPASVTVVSAMVGDRTVGAVEVVGADPDTAAAWLDAVGDTVSHAVGQLIDRFRARVRTTEAEERLALALDAGEFGVWTVDDRTGHAQWSERMAQFHMVEGDHGPEEALFASVVDDDRAAVAEALSSVRSGSGPATVAYRVIGPDGLRWISTRLTRVDDGAGPSFVAAVSSDTTETQRLERVQQRRRATVEALRWVHEAIIAGEALADTSGAVAERACGVLGAEVGVVVHPVPGDVGDALAVAVHGDAPVGDGSPPRLMLPNAEFVAAGVTSYPDAADQPDVMALVRSLGLREEFFGSALAAPIRGRERQVIGYLLFGSADRGFFGADDEELVLSIASTTGVAIDNALRHEQQRLAAATFQRQLLPSVDLDDDRVDLCVRYHPGRAGLDVGGDWYDVFERGDGRLGLAVGDVCGHGLVSASHMGQLRYSFRALLQADVPVEEAFRVLNRLALDDLSTTVTLAFVELDVRTGACTVWRCGHLPPLVWQPDGAARWLGEDDPHGPMLGFLAEVDVPRSATVLAPDETLLLYTDGLVERRGESIEFGLDRLAGSFVGAPDMLDDVCDLLYGDLSDPGPEADDTALLAVRLRRDRPGC